jgi:hypothetical protein
MSNDSLGQQRAESSSKHEVLGDVRLTKKFVGGWVRIGRRRHVWQLNGAHSSSIKPISDFHCPKKTRSWRGRRQEEGTAVAGFEIILDTTSGRLEG